MVLPAGGLAEGWDALKRAPTTRLPSFWFFTGVHGNACKSI